MKKILLLSFIVSMFVFASCEKTETFDDTRKLDNEAIFAKISTNSDYKKIESKTGAGYIMYKVLKKGESEKQPTFTDVVKVNYTGWFKNYWIRNGVVAGDEFIGDDGNNIKNKIIFYTTETNEGEHIASSFNVNGLVDGFSTALQHMQVGDKWEVWIPWQMGYGGGRSYIDRENIPEYTTLVFEIELKDIVIK